MTILKLFKTERPLAFFSIGFVFCILLAGALVAPVLYTYFDTGLVPRLPTFVLSCGLVLLGVILLICGLLLDTVTRGRNEAKRIAYLAIPAPRKYPD